MNARQPQKRSAWLCLALGLGVACGGDDSEGNDISAEASDTAGTETTAGDGDTGDGDGDTGDGETGDGDGDGDGETGDGDGDGDGDGETGDGDGETGDAMCEAAPDDNECETCAKASCCDELEACEADEKCACLSVCVLNSDELDVVDCVADCGGGPFPSQFNPLTGCLTASCNNECA
jgi:hypothetical protein